MTCEEFIKACVNSGYVYRSEVKELKKWLEENPKEVYAEEYFIEVYRHFDAIRYENSFSDKWRLVERQKTTKHYTNISGR